MVKMKLFFPALFALLALALPLVAPLPAEAVDVAPSKRTTPQKFIDPGGKRLRIFGGDPGRINKANNFDLETFKTELKFKQDSISLGTTEDDLDTPNAGAVVIPTFSVINNGDKTATLEFPDAQRFDLRVLNPAGQVVYVWSADKVFVEAIGKSIINSKDKISFRERIPLSTFSPPAHPGPYVLEAVLANYPQITARATFNVVP